MKIAKSIERCFVMDKTYLFLNRWCYVQFSVPQHYTFTLETHRIKHTNIKKMYHLFDWAAFASICWILTSACSRCASCSVSNVTKPYPLLTPARSTMIFVDFTLPYDENTRQSSASVVSPLIKQSKFITQFDDHMFCQRQRHQNSEYHMTVSINYSPLWLLTWFRQRKFGSGLAFHILVRPIVHLVVHLECLWLPLFAFV